MIQLILAIVWNVQNVETTSTYHPASYLLKRKVDSVVPSPELRSLSLVIAWRLVLENAIIALHKWNVAFSE